MKGRFMIMIKKLAKSIDHTLLKPDTMNEDVDRLCGEACRYDFASVCIPPCYVKRAYNNLSGSDVKVGTVIGFPLGYGSSDAKAQEAADAAAGSAAEIDMVMNIPALLNRDYKIVRNDIEGVCKAAGRDVVVKVIIETCLLTDDMKVEACKIIMDTDADFVKTSTGYSGGGATIEDVTLLNKIAGTKIKVKASGGIKSAEFALKLLDAGAARIGTSSGAVIMEQAKKLIV